jgi:hypothetical protein
MISPDNPMDLALRLLAQGKGRKAEVIANSRGKRG